MKEAETSLSTGYLRFSSKGWKGKICTLQKTDTNNDSRILADFGYICGYMVQTGGDCRHEIRAIENDSGKET